jgi:tetratricopeptide (TPR) repeat protein
MSEAAQHMDLLALVWNYQAEILMHPESPAMDLDAAEQVLRKNFEVSSRSGLQRSATEAASLLGLLLLRRGQLAEADAVSAQAVDEIERRGDMPAVRTEEIYYNRWKVLEGLGRHDEARGSLDRAWEVMQRKLDLMSNPDNRTAFLERVPLNLAIIEAHRSMELAEAIPGDVA